MAVTSDLVLDASKFSKRSVSQKTAEVNAGVIEASKSIPQWFEVGAVEFRAMRDRGETSVPPPVHLESAQDMEIPSRDPDRSIHLRVHTATKDKASGVFLHIHGGGWVLSDENAQDPFLNWTASSCNLTVVSVGYRLAPEHPFPAGPNDCYDAADWLVDNAKTQFNAELKFVGGESAGGHLSVLTAFHLLESRPSFELKGTALMYGVYELSSYLPHLHNFDTPLILSRAAMTNFVEAFVSHLSVQERRNPSVSPFYADLPSLASRTPSGKLPPAFFSVGTEDVLMDDTVLFATKWAMSGSETLVKIYPGAAHGFHLFPPDMYGPSEEFRDHLMEWISDCLK